LSFGWDGCLIGSPSRSSRSWRALPGAGTGDRRARAGAAGHGWREAPAERPCPQVDPAHTRTPGGGGSGCGRRSLRSRTHREVSAQHRWSGCRPPPSALGYQL